MLKNIALILEKEKRKTLMEIMSANIIKARTLEMNHVQYVSASKVLSNQINMLINRYLSITMELNL